MTGFPQKNSALLTWKEKNKYNKPQNVQLLRAAFPMVLPSESSNLTHTGAIQQYPLINLKLSLQPPGFGPLWRSKALSGIEFIHQIENHGTSSTRNWCLSITLLIMVLASTLGAWLWRDAEEDNAGPDLQPVEQIYCVMQDSTCESSEHSSSLLEKLFRVLRKEKVERSYLIEWKQHRSPFLFLPNLNRTISTAIIQIIFDHGNA